MKTRIPEYMRSPGEIAGEVVRWYGRSYAFINDGVRWIHRFQD